MTGLMETCEIQTDAAFKQELLAGSGLSVSICCPSSFSVTAKAKSISQPERLRARGRTGQILRRSKPREPAGPGRDNPQDSPITCLLVPALSKWKTGLQGQCRRKENKVSQDPTAGHWACDVGSHGLVAEFRDRAEHSC